VKGLSGSDNDETIFILPVKERDKAVIVRRDLSERTSVVVIMKQ
jgi:hypothetical protein